MNNAPRVFIHTEDDVLRVTRSDRWAVGLPTYVHAYALLEPEVENRLEIISMVWNSRIFWLATHPVIQTMKEQFPGLRQDMYPLNASLILDANTALMIKLLME
jgi:hypothetical protein